jgi:hypothetical protein
LAAKTAMRVSMCRVFLSILVAFHLFTTGSIAAEVASRQI